MFRQLLKLNCVTITILFWAFCFINSSLGQNRKKSITTAEKANSDSLTIPEKDTVIVKTGTKPSYRWQDRYLNRYSARVPQSPFYLKDPKNISNDFKISPDTKEISITEKVGKSIDYRVPQSLTFNEYSSIQNAAIRKSILRDYENLQDGKSATSGRGLRPLLEKNPIVDRIFGGNLIDLKPNGFVTLDFQLICSLKLKSVCFR